MMRIIIVELILATFFREEAMMTIMPRCLTPAVSSN